MSSLHSSLNFKPYPRLTTLNPGKRPLNYCLLVLMREVDDKQGSIIIPGGAKDREDEAGREGLLVAMCPAAFNEHDYPFRDSIPNVGEALMFARYAGSTFEGDDGRIYRMLKDKDVLGVIEKPKFEADPEAVKRVEAAAAKVAGKKQAMVKT